MERGEQMPKTTKRKKKKSTYYPDMCFGLSLLLVIALCFHGAGVVVNTLVSVVSAILFDYIGCKIINRKFRLKNCHAVFIGGLTALMLPASAPVWMPVLGSAFAIFLVKTPFGSLNHAPFSSVAAGLAFLSICRPDLFFDYSSAEFGSVSISKSLSQGTPIVTAVDLINAFIGTVPGAAGATCTCALLGILVFILIRHRGSFLNSFSFLFTDNFFAVNSLRIILLRMCSGFTLCLAVFFVTEDTLSPKKNTQRIFYSVMMGVVYIILGQVSRFEDAGCFAVLLTNAFWPVAEKYIFTPLRNKKEVTAVESAESLS